MGSITDIIVTVTGIVLQVIPVVTGLALLYFFWGLAQIILNAGDSEKSKEAKFRVLWGLIALFVIVSLGGLIAVINNTVFGDKDGSKKDGGSVYNPVDPINGPRDGGASGGGLFDSGVPGWDDTD